MHTSKDPEIDCPPEQFELEIEETGQVLTVQPGETMLDALESAGYSVQWMCRSGFCGTCTARVVEGQPDHRDGRTVDDTRNTVSLCVSRSRSPRLVVDLASRVM